MCVCVHIHTCCDQSVTTLNVAVFMNYKWQPLSQKIGLKLKTVSVLWNIKEN